MKLKILMVILLLSGCATNSSNQTNIEGTSPQKEFNEKNLAGAVSAGATLYSIVMTSSMYCAEYVPHNASFYKKTYSDWLKRNEMYMDALSLLGVEMAKAISGKYGAAQGDAFSNQLKSGVEKTTIDFMVVTYAAEKDKEKACGFMNVYNTEEQDIKNIKGYQSIIKTVYEKYKYENNLK